MSLSEHKTESNVKSLFQSMIDITSNPSSFSAAPDVDRRWSEAVSRIGVNSHIHLPPNFSAFDTVADAVARSAAEGIQVLGASNYYDYTVYEEFMVRCSQAGILPLFGLEIIALVEPLVQQGIKLNDPGNPGKMYLCGKGITEFAPLSPDAEPLLNEIRSKDSARMALLIERLASLFSIAGIETGLTEDAVKNHVVQRHGCSLESVYLQERHIAQSFQEALFAAIPPADRKEILSRLFGVASRAASDDAGAVQNEIRSHLMKAGKPAYVPETFVDFDHAYRLILALGGIPCYPILADGAAPICPFETPVEQLIEALRSRGIHFAELIPTRNSPETVAHYAAKLRSAGILVTAGTEHNTREMSPLQPLCAGGIPIPEPAQEIFLEGACVVAGHQYRKFHAAPGYVTAQGELEPGYSDAEKRIAAFRALGAAVITDYLARHASA